MTDEVAALLVKAERSCNSARRLMEDGDHDFAASRAYYAMFYTAEALLLTRGLAFSRHSAVHAAFGEHFAKPGLLDRALHRQLIDAFRDRQVGDYDAVEAVTRETAEKRIAQAERFLAAARDFLASPPEGAEGIAGG